VDLCQHDADKIAALMHGEMPIYEQRLPDLVANMLNRHHTI
jgi:UDP-glucose 6-dehydrogenase